MLKYGHVVLYAANLKGVNRLHLKESRLYLNNKPEAV